MFPKTRSLARKYGSKAAAVAALGSMAVPAFAADNPIVIMFESIDTAGIVAAVAAFGLVCVTLALTFKGPDVAKRGIKKI